MHAVIRDLITERLAKASLREILDLVEQPAPSRAYGFAAAADGPRFTKLGTDGKSTTGDHVAVYDAQTNLTWSADVVGSKDGQDWAQSMAAAKACRLLGHEDWRAPTIQELLSIVDYERYDPAVDTEYFRGPFGWTWSSTPAKSPSGCAWGVSLNYGYSYRVLQDCGYRVRAVRAGQSLALGL